MIKSTRRVWRHWLAAVTAEALTIGTAGVAAADNVKNDIAAGGGVGQNRLVEKGEVTSVNYFVQATGGTCDAADGSSLTLTINASSDVTKSANTLDFCAMR